MNHKELIKHGWHDLYIESLANPFENKSDADFAQEIGIPVTTLSSWKRVYREQIYEEADKRRKNYIRELRAKNFKAIAKSITDSFNDRKLLAQLTGDLVERTESRTELLTHDDKVRRVRNLLENISKRKEALQEGPGKEAMEPLPQDSSIKPNPSSVDGNDQGRTG